MGSAIVRKTTESHTAGGDFILSDATPDRYDDVIEPEGWDLRNFSKNPIALFNHNSDFPIGRWTNLRVEKGALRGRLIMAPRGSSSRIDEIHALIECGVLKAVSVGFKPVRSEPRKSGGLRYCSQELVETSLVSVPANPSALMQEKLMKAKAMGVSAATIREIFKEQNKTARTATIAERIAESRAAVRYTEQQKRDILRKAKETLARGDREREKAARDVDAQRAARAKKIRDDREARLKAEREQEINKWGEPGVFCTWRGMKIMVSKWPSENE